MGVGGYKEGSVTFVVIYIREPDRTSIEINGDLSVYFQQAVDLVIRGEGIRR